MLTILVKGKKEGTPTGFLTNDDGNVFPVFGGKYQPKNLERHREIVQKIHDNTTDPAKKAKHAEYLASLDGGGKQEEGKAASSEMSDSDKRLHDLVAKHEMAYGLGTGRTPSQRLEYLRDEQRRAAEIHRRHVTDAERPKWSEPTAADKKRVEDAREAAKLAERIADIADKRLAHRRENPNATFVAPTLPHGDYDVTDKDKIALSFSKADFDDLEPDLKERLRRFYNWSPKSSSWISKARSSDDNAHRIAVEAGFSRPEKKDIKQIERKLPEAKPVEGLGEGEWHKASAEDVNPKTALAAYQNTSWTPEERAAREGGNHVEAMNYAVSQLEKLATTPEKQALLKSMLEDYRPKLLEKHHAYLASRSRLASSAITGPSNFPVQQMERRGEIVHNKLGDYLQFQDDSINRMRKILTSDLDGGPIMSHHADAIPRLQEKLAKAEKYQESAKALNKIAKSTKMSDEEKIAKIVSDLGFSEDTARKALTPDAFGNIGVAAYSLTNNNANIRRIKEQIADIQKRYNLEKGEGPEMMTFRMLKGEGKRQPSGFITVGGGKEEGGHVIPVFGHAPSDYEGKITVTTAGGKQYDIDEDKHEAIKAKIKRHQAEAAGQGKLFTERGKPTEKAKEAASREAPPKKEPQPKSPLASTKKPASDPVAAEKAKAAQALYDHVTDYGAGHMGDAFSNLGDKKRILSDLQDSEHEHADLVEKHWDHAKSEAEDRIRKTSDEQTDDLSDEEKEAQGLPVGKKPGKPAPRESAKPEHSPEDAIKAKVDAKLAEVAERSKALGEKFKAERAEKAKKEADAASPEEIKAYLEKATDAYLKTRPLEREKAEAFKKASLLHGGETDAGPVTVKPAGPKKEVEAKQAESAPSKETPLHTKTLKQHVNDVVAAKSAKYPGRGPAFDGQVKIWKQTAEKAWKDAVMEEATKNRLPNATLKSWADAYGEESIPNTFRGKYERGAGGHPGGDPYEPTGVRRKNDEERAARIADRNSGSKSTIQERIDATRKKVGDAKAGGGPAPKASSTYKPISTKPEVLSSNTPVSYEERQKAIGDWRKSLEARANAVMAGYHHLPEGVQSKLTALPEPTTSSIRNKAPDLLDDVEKAIQAREEARSSATPEAMKQAKKARAQQIRESERARKADEKASREENFPSKWTPGSFDVATANGKRGVDGFRRGAFGYHESGDGYTVTHVPTGMAIHTAKGPAIAKRFINDIHKHEGLDWTSSNPDVYRRDHGAVIKRIKAEHAAGDAAVDAAVSAPTGQERSRNTSTPRKRK